MLVIGHVCAAGALRIIAKDRMSQTGKFVGRNLVTMQVLFCSVIGLLAKKVHLFSSASYRIVASVPDSMSQVLRSIHGIKMPCTIKDHVSKRHHNVVIAVCKNKQNLVILLIGRTVQSRW